MYKYFEMWPEWYAYECKTKTTEVSKRKEIAKFMVKKHSYSWVPL
jgi:hypothetical protein